MKVEQKDSLGGAVCHYPRHNIAMTAPVKWALVGNVRRGEIRTEKLLKLWHGIVRKTGSKIEFNERMEHFERQGDTSVVTSSPGQAVRVVGGSGSVPLSTRGGPRELPIQAVIVCAGGELPTPLLQRMDVALSTQYGTA